MADFTALYHKSLNDPRFFVEEVVGLTKLWQKQIEIMESVRDNPRTAVRSCNGAGKTYTTANTVAWFLTTNPGSIVISTAPTSRQVRELLWQEIRTIQARSKYPLGGSTTLTSWNLDSKWFALGLSTDDPNRFQGFHADKILGVIDEGAGVDFPIWEGMDSILTSRGARLLVIGNPTEPSGAFYNAFSSSLYNKIHISAFDTPNFTLNGITEHDIRTGEWKEKFKDFKYPALVTPQWVADRMQDWGEDSPSYQARVLGNFPIIGNDTMIPLGWVLKAVQREPVADLAQKKVIAVDVARFGDDDSVVGVRQGASYIREETFSNLDVHALAKQVTRVADEEGGFRKDSIEMQYIIVDAVGIGAGVADLLRAWGYNAIDFVAQGRAYEPDKFVNRRTEAWYRTRELFRKDGINMANEEKLIGQLTSPKYTFDQSGRYKLESKEDMKKRGIPSPDRADAMVMCFDFGGELPTHLVPDLERINKPENKDTVAYLLRQLSKGVEEEWNF